jgi:drug/metabolite transporter (DMT)-like permease
MPFGAFEFSQGGIAPFAAIHAIGLAFLALFSGLAAFFLYNFSLTGLEVGRMAVFVNLIPVFTAFFSWLLMGEKLALVHILGGSLVLGGVMTANLRRRTVEPPGEIY